MQGEAYRLISTCINRNLFEQPKRTYRKGCLTNSLMIIFYHANGFIKSQALFCGETQNAMLLGKLEKFLLFRCLTDLGLGKESGFALSVHCG